MNLYSLKILNRKNLIFFGLLILSPILLSISRPGTDIWPAAWLGFVPLLYLTRFATPKNAFIIAFISLTIGYTFKTNFIAYLAENFLGVGAPFSYGFLVLISAFVAAGYGVHFFLYRFLTINSKVPTFIIFPLTYIFVWTFYPQLFRNSFAETQLTFPVALQALDIFGQNGLNFIILMVNAIILEIIIGNWRKHLYSTIACLLLVIIWFSYGFKQYYSWREIEQGWNPVKIGFVQPNNDASFQISEINPGNTREFPWEMEHSIYYAETDKAKFIIWPEGNKYLFNENKSVKDAFVNQVKKYGFNLLFSEVDYQKNAAGENQVFNAILWIKPDGSIGQAYHKHKLMPFGEYLPGGSFGQWLANTLGVNYRGFNFGDKLTNFVDGDTTIIPAICYESLFPEYIAEQANIKSPGKIIVVTSQDGWYDSDYATAEHNHQTMLRAVENRTPILHVIQNGPTTLGLASGYFQYYSKYRTRSSNTIDIKAAPADNLSFYTQHPKLLDNSVIVLTLILLFISLYNFYRAKNKK